MMYEPTDFELNAYVDRELDTETAAKVADAAARDVEIAKRLAQLAALKASTPKLLPEIPEIDLTAPRREVRSRFPIHCRAAVIVASITLAIGFVALFVTFDNRLTANNKSWQHRAMERHFDWVKQIPGLRAGPVINVATLPDGLPVPDLRDAKLSLVVIERLRLGQKAAVRFGFTGSRGCRLSLFAVDIQDLKAIESPSTTLRQAQWQVGGRTFLLLSSGMDPKRFTHLARTLEGFTRRPSPLDLATRQQLAAARERSTPCVG